MATILTKKSDTASAVPLAADLTNAAGGAELAVNATDKRLFSKTSGGTVVELGTNPTAMAVVGNTTVGGTLGVTGATTLAGVSATTLSASSTVTLSGGTANGVAYLNGSKVVTSGSALTFDGTTFVAKSNVEIGNSLVDANRYVNIIGAGGNKDFGIQLGGSRVLWQNTGQSGLLFGVSDTEQMRLTSTGLGIGTSSPAYKLDVVGATGTTTSGVYETSASGSSIVISRLRTTGTGRGYWDIRTGNTASGLTGALDFFDNIAGASRLNLDSSGNLGLGVTPSAWRSGDKVIDIGSTSSLVNAQGSETRIYQNAYVSSGGTNTYKTTAPAAYFGTSSGAFQWFNAPSGTAGNAITFTQAMTLDASAQLQIGTTTASGKLTIDNTGASTPLIYAKSADQAGARIALSNTGTGGQTWQIVAGDVGVGNSGLSFYDGTATRARIDSSGNLLVGTTSTYASAKMSLGFVGSASNGLIINNTNSSGSPVHMAFQLSGTSVGNITCSGSSTAYNTSSDYRLKNTIAPMTGALAKVALLKPCTYKWNADGSDGEGFIAHELAEVVPQAVTGEKDAVDEEGTPKYQGIDTSFLVATLTAAIQELKASMDAVKAEFDAYKATHP